MAYETLLYATAAPVAIYRLGLAEAKEYALTGKPLSGIEAERIGLINKAANGTGSSATTGRGRKKTSRTRGTSSPLDRGSVP
jgi:enoyl-CoA hydratase/carnithine racemase